jgi:hypothetical protein
VFLHNEERETDMAQIYFASLETDVHVEQRQFLEVPKPVDLDQALKEMRNCSRRGPSLAD